MKRLIVTVILFAVSLCMIQGAPIQTLDGLRTNTALPLKHRQVQVSLAGYYRNVERPSYVDQDKNGLKFYGMLGVGLFDWAELSLFAGDYVYFANAKVRLLKESRWVPQVAVGMDNILSPVNKNRPQDYRPHWDPLANGGNGAYTAEYDPYSLGWIDHPDKTDYEHFSGYAVMSKNIFKGLNANLGIGFNRYTGQVPRSRWFSGAFSSVEIIPFDNFSILTEYDGKDFNAGLKYVYRDFGVRLGAEALEDLMKGSEGSGYENNFRTALDFSYTFSF